MINLQQFVPNIYYNSSRDFQLLCHLFDLVLNAVKTDADMLAELPFSEDSNDQLLELLSYTLGLKLDKAKYTNGQLRAVCSVIVEAIKNKGSLIAVKLLCTALMRADDLNGNFYIETSDDGSQLTIYLTKLATCRELLNELLPYVVPAGVIFNIKQATTIPVNATDNFMFTDTVRVLLDGPNTTLPKMPDDVLLFDSKVAGIFTDDSFVNQKPQTALLINAALEDINTSNSWWNTTETVAEALITEESETAEEQKDD